MNKRKTTMKVQSQTCDRHVRRWTVREFYRMGERSIFHPEERVELIEGVIYRMFPMSPAHATIVQVSYTVFSAIFGKTCYVRTQMPLHLGPRSEPLPDVAVVAGDVRDYMQQHPTTALLLIEVSDNTLRYDRLRKGSLYAKAGIADYWIVNLKKGQLKVYRDPIPDSTHYYGHRYSSITLLTAKDDVAPLSAPTARIRVADLLP